MYFLTARMLAGSSSTPLASPLSLQFPVRTTCLPREAVFRDFPLLLLLQLFSLSRSCPVSFISIPSRCLLLISASGKILPHSLATLTSSSSCPLHEVGRVSVSSSQHIVPSCLRSSYVCSSLRCWETGCTLI